MVKHLDSQYKISTNPKLVAKAKIFPSYGNCVLQGTYWRCFRHFSSGKFFFERDARGATCHMQRSDFRDASQAVVGIEFGVERLFRGGMTPLRGVKGASINPKP